MDWAYGHFLEFKDGTQKEQWADPAKTAELYLVSLNKHRGRDGQMAGRKSVMKNIFMLTVVLVLVRDATPSTHGTCEMS